MEKYSFMIHPSLISQMPGTFLFPTHFNLIYLQNREKKTTVKFTQTHFFFFFNFMVLSYFGVCSKIQAFRMNLQVLALSRLFFI